MGSVQHHTAALGADVEDVAPTCPQKFFHASLEGGQLFLGDKGLDGAGKATSVDPDGPSALQQLPPDGQGQRDGLLPGVGDRPGVLQVQGGL